MSDKKALLQAIAKEEALLSRLDSEREQALSRLNTLKQQRWRWRAQNHR